MIEAFSLEDTQTYFNEITGQPLRLCFDSHCCMYKGIKVVLEGVPLLKDDSNGEIFFPGMSKGWIDEFVMEAIEKDEEGIYLIPKIKPKRYSYAREFKFKYSSIDYEYIPGLWRSWNRGFLTPVFFNLAVLDKYSHHPDYVLDLFSETYGDVRFKDQWNISFGINKNKKVIMWLGDIDKLNEEEKYYLRSQNIESDHEIHSEFYDAQLEVIPSPPSIQSKAFHKRKEVGKAVRNAYGFDLFSLEGEVQNVLMNIDKPIFWEKKNVMHFFNSLNQIFVESVNVKSLKSYLLSNGVKESDLEKKGGMKLMEIWWNKISCGNDENVIGPFFVLYDLRMICSHLQSDEATDKLYASICDRLKLERNSGYEKIYYAMIEWILSSYEKMLSVIRESAPALKGS